MFTTGRREYRILTGQEIPMAFNQNNAQGKQHEDGEKVADAAKANLDKATEQGTRFVDASRARDREHQADRSEERRDRLASGP